MTDSKRTSVMIEVRRNLAKTIDDCVEKNRKRAEGKGDKK